MDNMDIAHDHHPDEHGTQGLAKLDLELHSIGKSHKVAVRRTSMIRVSSFQTRSRMQREHVAMHNSSSKRCEVAERLLTVFRRFEDDIVQQYFWSRDFAQDFLCLCEYTKAILREEPKMFNLRGPVHVFGDIHGNIEDLFFFRNKLWPTGMELTAGKFLFLGDYVDRGMNGLEVLTYLFASKVCVSHKIYLLRGNHELRYVNGWEQHYKDRSFLWQCKDRFGKKLGEKVWRAANAVFDCLPLACTIDESVFCSHGGIPRRRQALEAAAAAGNSDAGTGIDYMQENDDEDKANAEDTRIADIASMPGTMKITPMRLGPEEDEEDDEIDLASVSGPELQGWQTSLAMDLLWGDPCPSNPLCAVQRLEGKQESPQLNARGFGPGQRGGAAIMFGQRAVDEFFESNGFSIMLRAHQASAAGIAVSKNGKIVTVFSTSKDHALDRATCAYVLVEDSKVIAVNRILEEPVRVHKQRPDIRVQESAPSPAVVTSQNARDDSENKSANGETASVSSPKRNNKRSVNVFPLAAKIMSKSTTSQAA